MDFQLLSSFANTPDNPTGCQPPGRVDGWAAYTAEANQTVRLDFIALDNADRPEIGVYEADFTCGTSPAGSIVECIINPVLSTSSVEFTVTAGTTYLIRITNSLNNEMDGKICLYRADNLPADYFFDVNANLSLGDCGEQFNIPLNFEGSGGLALGNPLQIACAPGLPSLSDAWIGFTTPPSFAGINEISFEYDNRNADDSQANNVALQVFTAPVIAGPINAQLTHDGNLCADATAATSLALNTTYNNISIPTGGGGNLDPFDDGSCGLNFQWTGDTWFRLDNPANGLITVVFESTEPQIDLVIYSTNSGCAGLTAINNPNVLSLAPFFAASACIPADGITTRRILTLSVVNTNDYYVRVINNTGATVNNATLSLYAPLTQLGCVNTLDDNQQGVETLLIPTASLSPNTDYLIRVANLENANITTTGRICVRDGAVAQGDLCENPVSRLVGDCDVDFSFNDFRNLQPIPDPVSCIGGKIIREDGWFTFTATNTRTTIQYLNQDGTSAGDPTRLSDVAIAAYRGGCISPFLVGCADEFSNNGSNPNEDVETLRINTVPGLEYTIRVMNVGTDPTDDGMTGRVCIFNTAERDVCNDADLVTLNVGECNIKFDVPRQFSLTGINLRNFGDPTDPDQAFPADPVVQIPADANVNRFPFFEDGGSLDQYVESSCERVGANREGIDIDFSPTDNNTQPVAAVPSENGARDAWVRLLGNGEQVTLIYQNEELGNTSATGSDPSILVYTALQDVGPVNCGNGPNGAGFILNQYACANNIQGPQRQTESVTFRTNAGQRYIIRIIDMDGGANGMTGTLCIASGSQDYDVCSTARELEVGDCSVPLNVINGLSTCYVPATNPLNYPNIQNAPCNLPGLGTDGCFGTGGDSWATFTVDASLIPGGVLPSNTVTVEYDNRNYNFEVAADVALLVYRTTNCNDGAAFTLLGCADNLGGGEEGVEIVTVSGVNDGDVLYVRAINKNTDKTLFGRVCTYFGADVADQNCPPTEDYGALSGEFRNFTVEGSWTASAGQPTDRILDPPCVLPGVAILAPVPIGPYAPTAG
ncbi:MAG: hypothetical protein HC913_17590 [Microscillaceae bacterium]|nr:hypothetical protein [Microscillaceae bacterium]